MRKLNKIICTYAIALLVSLGLTTPVLAGSSEFAGIFGAIHASINGVSLKGTHKTGINNSTAGGQIDELTEGKVGAIMPVGRLRVRI
jgi:hypothetical protein